MRTFILAAMAAAALAIGPAHADGAPADWTGLRAGLDIGGGFGAHAASHTGLPTASVFASGDYNLDHGSNGWALGPRLGYHWQADNWVYGFDADFDFSNIEGTRRVSGSQVAQRNGGGANAANFVTRTDKMDYFGTLRATLGYAMDEHCLPYITAGWMYGHVKYSGQFHYAAPVDYLASDSAAQSGWTVGAGLAYQLDDGWALHGEYLYYDLGTHTILSNTVGGFQSQFDFDKTGNVVRFGVTYSVD